MKLEVLQQLNKASAEEVKRIGNLLYHLRQNSFSRSKIVKVPLLNPSIGSDAKLFPSQVEFDIIWDYTKRHYSTKRVPRPWVSRHRTVLIVSSLD